MKKIIALLLIAATLLTLASCGAGSTPDTDENDKDTKERISSDNGAETVTPEGNKTTSVSPVVTPNGGNLSAEGSGGTRKTFENTETSLHCVFDEAAEIVVRVDSKDPENYHVFSAFVGPNPDAETERVVPVADFYAQQPLSSNKKSDKRRCFVVEEYNEAEECYEGIMEFYFWDLSVASPESFFGEAVETRYSADGKAIVVYHGGFYGYTNAAAPTRNVATVDIGLEGYLVFIDYADLYDRDAFDALSFVLIED